MRCLSDQRSRRHPNSPDCSASPLAFFDSRPGALIIGLLTIPEFGMQFQRLFGRALLPGANIAPVTDLQATILAPLDSTRMTPRNEPLRFLVEIDGEREDLGRIEIQTRMLNKRQSPLVMSPRQNQRFSVDYNVGREPFEFRILEDGAPIAMKWGSELSQWFNMEVASRPTSSPTKRPIPIPRTPDWNRAPQMISEETCRLGKEPSWNFCFIPTKR